MHDDFDFDDGHLELGNFSAISSILMSSQPFTSKTIMIPNDLDEEIVWEVLKPQLILNQKTWDLHYKLFLP